MKNEKDKLWGGKERHTFEVRCGNLKWTIGARNRTEARNALVDLMAKEAAQIHLSDLSPVITLKTTDKEYPHLRLNDVIEEVVAAAGPEEEAADE